MRGRKDIKRTKQTAMRYIFSFEKNRSSEPEGNHVCEKSKKKKKKESDPCGKRKAARYEKREVSLLPPDS